MIKIKPSNRVSRTYSESLSFYYKTLSIKSSSKNKKVNLSSLDSSYFNKAPNPKMTKKIYKKLSDKKNHHYGSSIGDLDTRKVLSKFLSNDKIKFNEDDVIISHGGFAALNCTLFSILNSGDSLIVGKPTYTHYTTVSSFLGIEYLYFNYNLNEDNKLIDFEKLRNDILKTDNKPKAMFLVDPNNPINNILNGEQIENFFKICKEFNMLIILDNIFQKSVYYQDNFNIYIDMHYKYKVPFFSTSSITKSFHFPGCRFGYILKIDTENKLDQIWENGIKNFVQIPLSINTYMQKGIKEFFEEYPEGDMPYIEKNLKMYKANNEFVMEKLKDNKIFKPYKNFSSFFMYIGFDLSKLKYDTPSDFIWDLADKTNIILYPSEVFSDDEPNFRMTIGETREVIDITIDRIVEFANNNLKN